MQEVAPRKNCKSSHFFFKKAQPGWSAILIGLIALSVSGCMGKRSTVRTVFYNVENLFDTLDAPEKADEEFTPGSEKQYTAQRYQEKIDRIAEVLTAISPKDLPEFIGLAEVENRAVLEALIASERFNGEAYGIVHFEGPDFRGIDNAFLYRKDEFTPTEQMSIAVHLPNTNKTTRDVLLVSGLNRKNQKMHFFIVHFPSRWGGQEASEPYRIAAARAVRREIERLFYTDPDANIIVMGDFNDTPANNSAFIVMDGENTEKAGTPMINASASLVSDTTGTYFYRGEWQVLDQCIISKPLLEPDGLYFKELTIFKRPWMLYKNKQHNVMAPSRSFGGPNYYGGYSDHLPLVLTLKLNGK